MNTLYDLSPHACQSITLSEGDEIFCADGAMQVTPSPRLLGDTLCTEPVCLMTGQSWRAPCRTAVNMESDQGCRFFRNCARLDAEPAGFSLWLSLRKLIKNQLGKGAITPARRADS